jgi:Putative transposase
MTLDADGFIRRFLLQALPDGFHRIRHYGFLANGSRGDSLALCRRLLEARVTSAVREPADNHTRGDRPLTAADFAICPDCGGTMQRIAVVPRSCNPQPFSCETSDVPTDAHRDRARSQSCGQRCQHRHRAADQSFQSGMPTVPAPEIDSTAPHSPRSPVPRANNLLSARTPQPRLNVKRKQAFATIAIVPNLPPLRSIRLL